MELALPVSSDHERREQDEVNQKLDDTQTARERPPSFRPTSSSRLSRQGSMTLNTTPIVKASDGRTTSFRRLAGTVNLMDRIAYYDQSTPCRQAAAIEADA